MDIDIPPHLETTQMSIVGPCDIFMWWKLIQKQASYNAEAWMVGQSEQKKPGSRL